MGAKLSWWAIVSTLFLLLLFSFSDPTSARVENITTHNTPFSTDSASYDYSVPLGWGVMDPSITIDQNGNWYASLYYPCNSSQRQVYCVRILKNGATQSPEYRFDTYVLHGAITHAYQPPILFYFDNSLMLAHWAIKPCCDSFSSAHSYWIRGELANQGSIFST